MTDDDIVFGEVRLREPARLRRPDRDPRSASVVCGNPRQNDLPIFLDHHPALAIERHALSDTSVELGGILLGKECVDDETGEPFVLITQAIEAKHYENTQASFTYTHDSWGEITRERDEKFPELDIVGWYHTHPDFGIFLSSHDLFIHHNFFEQPLQVAYVVDPVRQTRGFFQWRDGELAGVRGFHVCGERGERVAIARAVNELESLPNTEGGSGLSPRLEAELIAMLSRPSPPTIIDRGSGAVLFGLIGLLLGAFSVAMAFMLANVTQQLELLKAQNDRLAAIAEKPAPDAQAGRDRASIKEQALDLMLSQIKVGDSPDSIRQRLSEALEQKLELERSLAQSNIEKEALVAHANNALRRVETVTAELSQARDRAEARAGELERRLDQSQNQALAARNDVVRSSDSAGDGLLSQGNVLLWAAVGGWLAFVFALAGLVAVWNRRPRPEPEYDPRIPTHAPRVATPPDSAAPHIIE